MRFVLSGCFVGFLGVRGFSHDDAVLFCSIVVLGFVVGVFLCVLCRVFLFCVCPVFGHIGDLVGFHLLGLAFCGTGVV
ncbi:hypothetical protein, partial [Acinetobacter baumannii]